MKIKLKITKLVGNVLKARFYNIYKGQHWIERQLIFWSDLTNTLSAHHLMKDVRGKEREGPLPYHITAIQASWLSVPHFHRTPLIMIHFE